MADNYALQAYGPGAGTTVNVTNSPSTGVQLTADARYRFITTAKTYIRFGASAAVAASATTDLWIPPDVAVDYVVKPGASFVSFVTGTTSVLNYAIVA